jgi:hypothetical protein
MADHHRSGSLAIAAPVAIVLVLVASSCGQSTSTATTPTPATATSQSKAVSPPQGGPVPAALLGDWFMSPAAVQSLGFSCGPQPTAANCFVQLTFTATTYKFSLRTSAGMQRGGEADVVINGSEIDFFNDASNGCPPLPDGVGRYTWALAGAVLSFTKISETCERGVPIQNQSWTRAA